MHLKPLFFFEGVLRRFTLFGCGSINSQRLTSRAGHKNVSDMNAGVHAPAAAQSVSFPSICEGIDNVSVVNSGVHQGCSCVSVH